MYYTFVYRTFEGTFEDMMSLCIFKDLFTYYTLTFVICTLLRSFVCNMFDKHILIIEYMLKRYNYSFERHTTTGFLGPRDIAWASSKGGNPEEPEKASFLRRKRRN